MELEMEKDLLLHIYERMVKSRCTEERLIQIYRQGQGYFWIGGPGEEAFYTCLALLGKVGEGRAWDWWHFHYRATAALIAMGMDMKDAFRLMMNRQSDPSTQGRNFAGHYCFRKWNVAPISSPIGVQYSMAIGTAHAQKRQWKQHKAITVVTGGDAGTAEGDFASCLIWSSRKGQELPLLVTVQNNRWGISTAYEGQHGESTIAHRARAFNIRATTINGNDPWETYKVLKEEMAFIRKTGKPSFVEVKVSRLYGHSSASGANFVSEEEDGLHTFEEKLLKQNILSPKRKKNLWEKYRAEARKKAEEVQQEAPANSETLWEHCYYKNEEADWRNF